MPDTPVTIDEALQAVIQQLYAGQNIVVAVAIGAADPAALGGDAPAEESVILFLDSGASDCEAADLLDSASAFAQPFHVAVERCSRFEGLQAAGESIAPFDIYAYNIPPVSAGTLGAAVQASGRWYLVGSNHVLAHNGRTPPGATIFAPGPSDSVTGGSPIASLSGFVPMTAPAWPLSATNPNQFDCAWAALAAVPAQTTLLNAIPATTGMPVSKVGRTTGKTQAFIAYRSWCGFVDFTFGSFYFTGQAATFQAPGTNPTFAEPGDSGSLVTSGAARAVGMVCARAYLYDSAGEFRGYAILISPLPTAVFTAKLGADAKIYSLP